MTPGGAYPSPSLATTDFLHLEVRPGHEHLTVEVFINALARNLPLEDPLPSGVVSLPPPHVV